MLCDSQPGHDQSMGAGFYRSGRLHSYYHRRSLLACVLLEGFLSGRAVRSVVQPSLTFVINVYPALSRPESGYCGRASCEPKRAREIKPTFPLAVQAFQFIAIPLHSELESTNHFNVDFRVNNSFNSHCAIGVFRQGQRQGREKHESNRRGRFWYDTQRPYIFTWRIAPLYLALMVIVGTTFSGVAYANTDEVGV